MPLGQVASHDLTLSASQFAERLRVDSKFELTPNQSFTLTDINPHVLSGVNVADVRYLGELTKLFNSILASQRLCLDDVDFPFSLQVKKLSSDRVQLTSTEAVKFHVRPADCETTFSDFFPDVGPQQRMFRFPPGQRIILRDIPYTDYPPIPLSSLKGIRPIEDFFARHIPAGFSFAFSKSRGVITIKTVTDYATGVYFTSDRELVIAVRRLKEVKDSSLALRGGELAHNLARNAIVEEPRCNQKVAINREKGSGCWAVFLKIAAMAASVVLGILFGLMIVVF